MFRRLPSLIAATLVAALPAALRAQTAQYTSAAGVTYRSDKDTGAVARAERALAADPKNVDRWSDALVRILTGFSVAIHRAVVIEVTAFKQER